MRRGARPATQRRVGWVLACLVGLASVQTAAAEDQPGCGVVALPMRSGQLAYNVGHTFIHQDSDSAWTRSGGLAGLR